MFINFSPRFQRSYKNLPQHIQEDFKIKIQLFIKNPYYSTLRTHKLEGRLQECLAFRLKNGFRILFEFSSSDTINLLNVGSHDIYKKY